jgi:hypothetical protein
MQLNNYNETVKEDGNGSKLGSAMMTKKLGLNGIINLINLI